VECHGGKCTVEVGGMVAGDVGAMCVGGLVDTINHCRMGAKRFWLRPLYHVTSLRSCHVA
jgi:hypothetical protein